MTIKWILFIYICACRYLFEKDWKNSEKIDLIIATSILIIGMLNSYDFVYNIKIEFFFYSVYEYKILM